MLDFTVNANQVVDTETCILSIWVGEVATWTYFFPSAIYPVFHMPHVSSESATVTYVKYASK